MWSAEEDVASPLIILGNSSIMFVTKGVMETCMAPGTKYPRSMPKYSKHLPHFIFIPPHKSGRESANFVT